MTHPWQRGALHARPHGRGGLRGLGSRPERGSRPQQGGRRNGGRPRSRCYSSPDHESRRQSPEFLLRCWSVETASASRCSTLQNRQEKGDIISEM